MCAIVGELASTHAPETALLRLLDLVDGAVVEIERLRAAVVGLMERQAWRRWYLVIHSSANVRRTGSASSPKKDVLCKG